VGRVPAGGVGTVGDGGSGQHLAGFGVDHGHLLCRRRPGRDGAGDVEGQAAGAVAAGEGPLGGELVGVGVEADDLALVFNVVEDRSLAVDGGEFGLAGEGDGGDDLLRGGVDDGDVFAAAVEGPDGLGGRLEDDAVGVLAGGDGGDGGQGGAVEDDYGVAAAVGDVAEFAGCVEGDAVGAVEAGDGAHRFAGLSIEDFDAGAVGEVEAVGRRVGEQVIPAAVAADLPAVEDLVGLLLCASFFRISGRLATSIR
jgi:hypothetical protein